jgi:hypothetical protein
VLGTILFNAGNRDRVLMIDISAPPLGIKLELPEGGSGFTHTYSFIFSARDSDPRNAFAGNLILDIGGFVELLIIIDAERVAALPNRRTGADALWWEEACRYR